MEYYNKAQEMRAKSVAADEGLRGYHSLCYASAYRSFKACDAYKKTREDVYRRIDEAAQIGLCECVIVELGDANTSIVMKELIEELKRDGFKIDINNRSVYWR